MDLNEIKNRVIPKIFYKYFFRKPKEIKFDKVEMPNVNKRFT